MKKILLIYLTLFSLNVFAENHYCIPENNLYISVEQKNNSTTEKDFNKAIDDIEKIYSPIFKDKYNAELKVDRRWEDGTVNAYASQTGNVWNVAMFGGLARHEAVTLDAFRAVVCHEVGHHVGGAPKKTSWFGGVSWASNEGQADYFATSKCLRKYFEVDSAETIRRYEKIQTVEGDFAKSKCDEAHSSVLEAAICLRGAMAGHSLAELFRHLRSLPESLRFDNPDPKVATTTDHNHPAPQCRLDTYFAGALCDKDQNLFPSSTDAATAYCVRKDGYDLGVRPLCWFTPSQYNL